MDLKIVADMLEQAGLGRVGRTIFAYHMPDARFEGVIVIPELEGFVRDQYIPGMSRGMFRVVLRSAKGYPHLLAEAKKVIRALTVNSGGAGDIEIRFMRPIHDPIPFPVPDSDIVEALVTVSVVYIDRSDDGL